MKNYLDKDPWKVIESDFFPEYNKITESICSIGNGYMGQRANFEESFIGETMQGSYLAGIYYPDKTKVGWWKNGYPEYFAKVLNSVNWIGIDIYLDNRKIEVSSDQISNFSRTLDMKRSLLSRTMTLTTDEGFIIKIQSERFCSWTRKEIGAIRYSVTSVNYKGRIDLVPYLDFDIRNQDSNYDERFWEPVNEGHLESMSFVQAYTKKTLFEVNAQFYVDSTTSQMVSTELQSKSMRVGKKMSFNMDMGDTISIDKLVSICSTFYIDKKDLSQECSKILQRSIYDGYEKIKEEHIKAWQKKWDESDIIIEGDVAAQQGVRFNIFHLHQTYSGDDARLNIGPKGFTGEKYGGSTYWDTEAYCIPFFLSNTGENVSRNLLMYRYKQLDKAIENAKKLGFKDGAALYPMVTMNGEECHNEWEITFEEIHRNGAIAYAIHDYTRYTGSTEYLYDYGIDVLIAIARFWAQRVNWSRNKKSYVILGVTGPNEYENNVNNNWYTNYIATWCLQYARNSVKELKHLNTNKYLSMCDRLSLKDEELALWDEIGGNMYYPFDEERQIFMQQDGFLDKEILPVSELNDSEQPIHQNWSWDRILRSCYIKQADVLQGMYFFEEKFDLPTIQKHFEFYEPLTVHESSLSPCVHAILASKLGKEEKAYEMYLRTARLDLDDYNNDTEDGLHITSMAGTWMSIVKGFGGMKVVNDVLNFSPFIPANWTEYSFKIRFRKNVIAIKVSNEGVELSNITGDALHVRVYNKDVELKPTESSLMQML